MLVAGMSTSPSQPSRHRLSGWYCSDRICQQGKGAQDSAHLRGLCRRRADVHLRRPSRLLEHDRRVPAAAGDQPGERVCLFMDRVPELYSRLPRRPRRSAPSPSRCSRPSATSRSTPAWATPRPRPSSPSASTSPRSGRSCDRLPDLRHIIVVDDGEAPLKEREVAFDLDARPARRSSSRCFPSTAESPSVLHYTSGTHGPAQGRPARPLLADLAVPDREVGARPAGRRHLLVHRRPGVGHRDVLRHHRPVVASESPRRSSTPASRPRAWYGSSRSTGSPSGTRRPRRSARSCATGAELAARFDLSSLRHLASVGEPLNAEAVIWSQESSGCRSSIPTGRPRPAASSSRNYPGMPIKPGSMGKPFPGITATILNPKTFEPSAEPGQDRPDRPRSRAGRR